ncbi:MAG TPA: hypothetical protein VMR18_04375 [Candidatus Saccharimonadales bacterium]|nr:hypothetical protein [Candidatus Saccharimonadales bacterium]
MLKKKPSQKDIELKEFIKAGGRKGAKVDFNEILKRAVKPKIDTMPTKKPK